MGEPAEKKTRRRRPALAIVPHKTLTDLGNAERFVERNKGRIRYCPPRKKWLAYDGKRWRWDDDGVVVRLAKRTVRDIYREASECDDERERKMLATWAKSSESSARIGAMLELASTEAGVPVQPDELDPDPWLLNVQNGTLDLRSGELREHSRDDLITKIAPVPYDPEAQHDLWEDCLTDATGGDEDLVIYLGQIFGYALTGVATEKAFFFFYGPSNTSKSTVLRAWENAIGDYALSADFETWLKRRDPGGNRGDLVRLMGARLVTSSEVGRGGSFDERIMKSVTGGDPITAAAKYEADVTFKPTFTLVLAANDAPRIRDDDDGMWNRVQRVPFTNVIKTPDPTMRDRLCEPEVAQAVLAWGVRGCLEWQAEGLRPPRAVQESTEAYKAESDRFQGFANDTLVADPEGSITRAQLRKLYETWCEEEGVKPLGARELGNRLRSIGATDGKNKGKRLWRGVRDRDMYDR